MEVFRLKVTRSVWLTLIFVILAIWGCNRQWEVHAVKAKCDLHTQARIDTLAWCVLDATKGEKELPPDNEGLLTLLAGDYPVRRFLGDLCRGPKGEFLYTRLSTNSFAVSCQGELGIIRVVWDGQHMTADPVGL
jgi:hypothetical protein